MRGCSIALTLSVLLALAAPVLAVPGGKTIEFNNSPMGRVIFDGEKHKQAGATCKECHTDGMFPVMKQGTVKITMAEIYDGKLCGACHNGKKAFEAKANCQRCHIPQSK